MTDITINIKTGSENSEPKVTTTTDNTTAAAPQTKLPEGETSKIEMKEEAVPKQDVPKEEMKEDTDSEKTSTNEKSSDKDNAKEMPALSSDRDMTEEEHEKMGSEK